MEMQQDVFRALSEPAVPWREFVLLSKLNACVQGRWGAKPASLEA